MITLLALSDRGAPASDHVVAAQFVSLGNPCFAGTPDQFPDLMAAVIKRDNINQWAAGECVVTTRAG